MAERVAIFSVLTLSTIASTVADSLYRFVEELPEAAKEIRQFMGTLFEVKTLLQELNLQFQNPKFGRLSRDLLNDIVLGVGSCSTSLRELDGIVFRGTTSRRGSSPRSARKAWNEIQSAFRNVEGYTLQTRFDTHRTFLFNLSGLLKNTYVSGLSKRSEGRAELARLQDEIRQLANQQQTAAARMKELEESHRRVVEEQTYISRYPLPLPTPPYESPPRRPYTPMASPYSAPPVDSYPRYMMNDSRPVTPMTPISPISPISPLAPPMPRRYSNTPAPTASRTATPPTPPISRPRMPRNGNSSTSSGSKENWWSDVFGSAAGSTTLSDPPRNGSQCFGMPMDSLNMAPEEHEIFHVEFDNDLILRMFRNSETEAAKVVCTAGGSGGSWNSGRRNGYRFQTFIDASYLTISREGSGIKLKRRGITWASLYFADYETMVLFYHAFLALRYHGPSSPPPKESEHWLDGEELMFSAKIDEDGSVHHLRLLKDQDSGCVRLAAAKVSEDEDVTLWTAFISKQIYSSGWMYFARPNTVLIKDIRLFSFSACFATSHRRDFELRFRIPGDAKDFNKFFNNEPRANLRRNPSANRNSYF